LGSDNFLMIDDGRGGKIGFTVEDTLNAIGLLEGAAAQALQMALMRTKLIRLEDGVKSDDVDKEVKDEEDG
jgi:hypothetical protein